MQTKTGLLFGSFDPIHIGHLVIAEFLLHHAGLDEVWFVVSPHNPLKVAEQIIEIKHRVQMTRLAISGYTAFKLCEVELDLPQPSYTIDTLELLRKTYRKRTFNLIIGSDNLAEFHRWRDFEKILEQFKLLVYPRLPIRQTPFDQYKSVTLVQAPIIEISSTYIRNMFSENKCARAMIPGLVYDYIIEHKLYVRS